MAENNVVSIVLITDDNYILPTSVVISSLICNRNENTDYHIYVLFSGICTDKIAKLEKMSANNLTVKIVVVDDEKINSLSDKTVMKKIPASSTSRYKFLIPELFGNLDKILYIDTDVMIRKDLAELFSIDINSVYAAVVRDFYYYDHPSHCDILGMKHHGYFNTGVMLLNLKKMRCDNIISKLLEYRCNKVNYFMDQDAFNAVFDGNVMYINIKYNFMLYEYYKRPLILIRKYNNIKGSVMAIKRNAVIVHFTTFLKPWSYYGTTSEKEWYDYLQHSVFKQSIDRKNLILRVVKLRFREIKKLIYKKIKQ